MRLERHVFGSIKGYTTLAQSPGIGVEDVRLLENLAFSLGQTYDPAFWASLSKHFAYFTSILPGGRRGLTRVLPGGKDDENRPTSRMITVILTAADWGVIGGDVLRLLKEASLWQWDGEPRVAAFDIKPASIPLSLPGRPDPKVIATLGAVEKAIARGRNLIASSQEFSLEQMAALEMLASPEWRGRFTSSYRSLGTQLPVTINCLADESPARDRVTFHPSQEAPTTPYARYVHDHWTRGTLTREVIMSYQDNKPSKAATPSGGMPGGIQQSVVMVEQRWPAGPLLGLGVMAIVLSALAFWGAYHMSREETRGLAEKQDSMQQTLASLQQAQDSKTNATSQNAQSLFDQATKDVTQTRMDVIRLNKEVETLKEDLAKLQGTAANRDELANLRNAYFIFVRQDCETALARYQGDGDLPTDLGALSRLQVILTPFASDLAALPEADRTWVKATLAETGQWMALVMRVSVTEKGLKEVEALRKEANPNTSDLSAKLDGPKAALQELRDSPLKGRPTVQKKFKDLQDRYEALATWLGKK